MIAQASPRPWALDGDSVAMCGQIVIVAPAPDGASYAEQKANSALIVRAVNAHDAMREMLREIVAAESHHEGRSTEPAWYEGARAALALAEGEVGT